LAHLGRKFERFLEVYRRPDGGRWTGAELARATAGAAHCSYVANLPKGSIGSPGHEKLATIAKAIARAMGFLRRTGSRKGSRTQGAKRPRIRHAGRLRRPRVGREILGGWWRRKQTKLTGRCLKRAAVTPTAA